MPTKHHIRSAKTLSKQLENAHVYEEPDKTNPYHAWVVANNNKNINDAISKTTELMKLTPMPPKSIKGNQTPKTKFVRGGKRNTFRKHHNKSVKKHNKKTRQNK